MGGQRAQHSVSEPFSAAVEWNNCAGDDNGSAACSAYRRVARKARLDIFSSKADWNNFGAEIREYSSVNGNRIVPRWKFSPIEKKQQIKLPIQFPFSNKKVPKDVLNP
jgi:hypothetical protein